jgi:flagellar basal body rod protein FlgC
VDLVDDMVGLMSSSVAYRANARAYEMGEEAEKSLFDQRV